MHSQRCRSILSEAITNQRARGILTAASAGSAPVDAVHPLTLRFLQVRGYDTAVWPASPGLILKPLSPTE
ncbi:MAG: hypothetical protein CM15mP74_16230 [Halieaceae bacterium]|nr:MAG: hypothetical protein CM15mP74_16230 [Halieaceae bacterium]